MLAETAAIARVIGTFVAVIVARRSRWGIRNQIANAGGGVASATRFARGRGVHADHEAFAHALTATVAGVVRAQVSILLAGRSGRRVRIGFALAGSRIAGCSPFAWRNGVLASHLIEIDAGTLTIAVIERTQGAVCFTFGAKRRIGQLIAGTGCGVADFATVTWRIGIRTNDVVTQDTVACSVADVIGAKIAVPLTESPLRRIGQVITSPGSRIAHGAGIAWAGWAGANHLIKDHAIAVAVAMLNGTQVSILFARRTQRRIGQHFAEASQRVTLFTGITFPGRVGAGDLADVDATAQTIAFIKGAQAAVIFTRRALRGVGKRITGSGCGRTLGAGVAELAWSWTTDIAAGEAPTHAIALIKSAQVAVKFATGAGRRVRKVIANAGAGVAYLARLTGRHRAGTHNIVEIDTTASAVAMIEGTKVAVELARGAERGIGQFFAQPGHRIALFASFARRHRPQAHHVRLEDAFADTIADLNGAEIAIVFAV